MLSREMYSEEYITDLRQRTGSDPTLLEKVIYAFGLLEAIAKVGLSFCFKGGTALMLLLDRPARLSTDIDIIVEPGTDIDEYIQKAGEIFPFVSVNENIRVGKNNIEKRHFRFYYRSPRSGREVRILLDVLFEKIQYEHTVCMEINNELLITEGENFSVRMPDINSILGDKLTAFAPHTTGIPFGVDKELEIIKQFFDCAVLFDSASDIVMIRNAYEMIVKSELAYRGLDLDYKYVLRDTAEACICIAGRGATRAEEYKLYLSGISKIRPHIFGNKFNGELAGAYACRLLYLVSCIMTEQRELLRVKETDISKAVSVDIPNVKLKRFHYIHIIDKFSYQYLLNAVKLLNDYSIDLLF